MLIVIWVLCNAFPLTTYGSSLVVPSSQYPSKLLQNDTDPDDDLITMAAVNDDPYNVGTPLVLESGATLTVQADGSFFYTPPAGFVGTDRFTYTVTDGIDYATVPVSIQVSSPYPNNAPFANDDQAVLDLSQAQYLTINVRGNDTDPDQDPIIVQGTTQATHGTVFINPDNTVTYIPDAGYTGTDTFTYTVSDGRGGTATATVTLTVSGTPPTPGSIGDSVWADANGNGVQDAGEGVMFGVTVWLLDNNGNPLLSTVTGADGNYFFDNVSPGQYMVEFDLPDSAASFTAKDQGGDDALDSDVNSDGYTDLFTLAAGQSIVTLDAGIHPSTG